MIFAGVVSHSRRVSRHFVRGSCEICPAPSPYYYIYTYSIYRQSNCAPNLIHFLVSKKICSTVPETSVAGDTIQYPTPESAGQFYVHHVSQNVAVLLTQGLLLSDSSPDLGVSSSAAGQYKCEARNVDETDSDTVTIEVNETEYCEFFICPTHIT